MCAPVAGGASYEAVDVIFNPWVASRCEGRPGAGFRVDVVKLALSWIEQELRVSLNPVRRPRQSPVPRGLRSVTLWAIPGGRAEVD